MPITLGLQDPAFVASQINLLDRLVGYWKMGENGEADRASEINSLTMTRVDFGGLGSLDDGLGIIGNGTVFPGDEDGPALWRESEGLFDVSDLDFSWSCWVYPLSLTNSGIAISAIDNYSIDVKGVFMISGDSSMTFDTAKVGEWNHVVCTYTAGSGRCGMYMNNSAGTKKSIGSRAVVTLGTATSVVFGHSGVLSGAYSFSGTIDEIGFWKKALTDKEVLELYNSGAGFQYPFKK